MCFNDNDKFETIVKVNISDTCSTVMIYVFDMEIQNENVKI